MSVITRLVQGKKNPNRVNVYLDTQFAFTLSLDEVVNHHLKIGKELTEAEIEALVKKDGEAKVYAKLLNFISFRPRSVKEVRDRLYQYDVRDKAAQDGLIERLVDKGHLDDLAFAHWFIESRNTHKLRAPRMILQELAAKGISREILEQVQGEVNDENETLRALLTKKLGDPRPLESSERQQISLYLSRQGFAWDKIREVVKSWESE